MKARSFSPVLGSSLLLALVRPPGLGAEVEAGGGKGRAAARKQSPVAPPSDEFCLRSGPGGRLHLLTYEFEKTRFALRVCGDSGFGEPRYLQSPLGPKEIPDWFDLQVGPDGSAHLFVMKSGDRRLEGYLFAYLPPEKEAKKKAPEAKAQIVKPAWVPLSGGAGAPAPFWGRPDLLPQKNGALEVFSQVLVMKNDTLQSRRLVRGLLERGRFRVTGSLDLDNGPFQALASPEFIALPNGEPVALYFGEKGMAWTTLKKFQPVAACPAPKWLLEDGTLLVLNRKGIAHLALPESIEEGKDAKGEAKESGYRYRLARGKPFATLEALGLLPDQFSLPNAILAATPDGRTWLAGVPGRTQDLGPVVAWELSGRFPPKPAAMPFSAAPHRLDAAVSGDELWLAFSVEEGICVERAILPAGAGE